MKSLKTGDHVVYRKQKASPNPSPRAVDVSPCEHGDQYWYFVDKYWTVSDVVDDRTVEVVTRRGKRHHVSLDDRRLRKSTLLEELLYQGRFPKLGEVELQPTVDVLN